MSSMLTCAGEITLNTSSSPECLSGWTSQLASIPFDISQIDPSVATAIFGAGFGLFITPWAAAWGVSQIFRILR